MGAKYGHYDRGGKEKVNALTAEREYAHFTNKPASAERECKRGKRLDAPQRDATPKFPKATTVPAAPSTDTALAGARRNTNAALRTFFGKLHAVITACSDLTSSAKAAFGIDPTGLETEAHVTV
ncbi:MAG: hypothetical protein RJA70_3719 [Pseudomonadota bacterium]